MKYTLTRENFWDEMEQKYPKAMSHFKQWIDQYKSEHDWNTLFNTGYIKFTEEIAIESDLLQEIKTSVAPKYHELPIAMQYGIFIEFAYGIAIKQLRSVDGHWELTTPFFMAGVMDSIEHLLVLMEDGI